MINITNLHRRHFLQHTLWGGLAANSGLSLGLGVGLVGCSGDSGSNEPAPPPESQIDDAIAQLDALAAALMASSQLPGMAVAVVRGDKTVYAKGFGTRIVGSNAPVNADTVFQLASMSKSVGATVVATQVGLGRVAWNTAVQKHLPWFQLKDAAVSAQVTIGDLYSHQSGLPDHAGDRLEDMGYDQRAVLERLRHLALAPLRQSYAYTNFGLTAAGLAVAAAAGSDWATLSQQAIYAPLGMTRTSSRFSDFTVRDNRAVGHTQVNGVWMQNEQRMPDAQAPAASVSSSVNDLAKWLSMLLGNGVLNSQRIVDAPALAAALAKQVMTSPATTQYPASYYGYGFNVGDMVDGRASYSHSGAFASGAATTFRVVPSCGPGIVVLTNGWPIGVAEALAAQFFDLVLFGSIKEMWPEIFASAMHSLTAPEGSLVGVARPAHPLPQRSITTYTGTYTNDYHGPLQVIDDGGEMKLMLGATPLLLPLRYWDGDVYTFTLVNENAVPGTLSKATFASDRVTLEYHDHEGLGTFMRTET